MERRTSRGRWRGPGIALAIAWALAAGPAAAEILVSEFGASAILRFREGDGMFLGAFASGAPLQEPAGMEFGPDGLLYVADLPGVLRFSSDGGSLGTFTVGGALVTPVDVEFGPDGNLYVLDLASANVARFDGQTGAFIDVFADLAGSPGSFAITFGPDGTLYVSDSIDRTVSRHDGSTGAFIDDLVTGALFLPTGLCFGPDEVLYVGEGFSQSVRRYDPSTGALLGTFASAGVTIPQQIAFGPDGDFYAVNILPGSVSRHDGATGAFLGVAATGGGLDQPTGVAFPPPPKVPSLPRAAAAVLALCLCASARSLLRGRRQAPGRAAA